jgi:hypothetical protein
MFVEDLRIIKPSAFGPFTTIQSAIQAALVSGTPAAVFISPDYAGTDTYTNASGVTVIDLRTGAANTGSTFGSGTGTQVNTVAAAGVVVGSAGVAGGGVTVGGKPSGVAAVAAAAAPITAAAAVNVFTTTLNLPTNTFNGVPFVVKMSGHFTTNGGTYTATVQPLIYASTSAGFTASAAATVYSPAAFSVTVASALAATLTKVNWQAEVHLEGDTTTGAVSGFYQGADNNGVSQLVDLATIPITNATLGVVNFAAATPLQFLAGVTTVGATIAATAVATLDAFFIEA